MLLFVFFFNDTATTEIYTLSLHDALPISDANGSLAKGGRALVSTGGSVPDPATQSSERANPSASTPRSEEHTSELQSHLNLVCRLLLEKKKGGKQALRDTAKQRGRETECV